MSVTTRAGSETEPTVAVPTEPILRLRVEQYHQMLRAGILIEGDPVELLQGWLVVKMTKNRPHSIATQVTREALARLLPPGWYVDTQEPVTTHDSEPEPDVAVIRGRRRDYPEHHPGPEDVALVVEVADASLQRDRTIKKHIYASAAVPTYWIVNLVDRRLEVYTDPTGPVEQADYRSVETHNETAQVTLMLEGHMVAAMAVKDLLP